METGHPDGLGVRLAGLHRALMETRTVYPYGAGVSSLPSHVVCVLLACVQAVPGEGDDCSAEAGGG